MDNPSPASFSPKKRKVEVVSGLHPSSKMPGMNNIHCLQVTGGESMPKKYYYMVSNKLSISSEIRGSSIGVCGWGHQKQVHQRDQEQVQNPNKPAKITICINMVNITCYIFIGFYT